MVRLPNDCSPTDTCKGRIRKFLSVGTVSTEFSCMLYALPVPMTYIYNFSFRAGLCALAWRIRVGVAQMIAGSEQPAGAGPKAKIFISYSRKDMAFADRLEAAL